MSGGEENGKSRRITIGDFGSIIISHKAWSLIYRAIMLTALPAGTWGYNQITDYFHGQDQFALSTQNKLDALAKQMTELSQQQSQLEALMESSQLNTAAGPRR